MNSEYYQRNYKIFQRHPDHGERELINAGGHGQMVWIGEVGAHLLILDQWSVMGDKDGSLRVLDPDTLDWITTVYLDFDAVSVMGLDENNHFVVRELSAGESKWRAWSLYDWKIHDPYHPPDLAVVRPLKELLTRMNDLPVAP